MPQRKSSGTDGQQLLTIERDLSFGSMLAWDIFALTVVGLLFALILWDAWREPTLAHRAGAFLALGAGVALGFEVSPSGLPWAMFIVAGGLAAAGWKSGPGQADRPAREGAAERR